MSDRITLRILEAKMAAIARLEGRPETTGHNVEWHGWVSHPGALHLERWAPGDGWTRYRLQVVDERGGYKAYGWGLDRYYNGREMAALLDGIAAGVESQQRRAQGGER